MEWVEKTQRLGLQWLQRDIHTQPQKKETEVVPDFWAARQVKFLPVIMRPDARLPFKNTRHRVSFG